MAKVYISAALPKSANAALQKAGVDFEAYTGSGLITEATYKHTWLILRC